MVVTENRLPKTKRKPRRSRQERTKTASPLLVMTRWQLLIHRLLCVLIVTVIASGIARKMAPQSLGIAIFFFEDLVIVVLLLLCKSGIKNTNASRLLDIFGTKQYVLFPTVAVAMCVAYLPNHRRQLLFLFRLIAFSVVVTTLIAV